MRCVLNDDSKVKKMASESSNTAGTEETPFLDKATQRYCLMAVTNISWEQNTGPAFWRQDNINSRDRILDRSSWDLKTHTKRQNRLRILKKYITEAPLGELSVLPRAGSPVVKNTLPASWQPLLRCFSPALNLPYCFLMVWTNKLQGRSTCTTWVPENSKGDLKNCLGRRGGGRERITWVGQTSPSRKSTETKTSYRYMCSSNALLVINKCLYKGQSNKTTKAHGHLLRI